MSENKVGVVLMNLGSPDSTSTPDVKRYLNQFLMDKRVIDIPYLARLALIRGIIVPTRAPKSAEAYKEIWTKEGSPLVVITRQVQAALQQHMKEPVEIAMRYGNPSAKEGFDRLMKRAPGLEEVIAVPMYPHYAMSSYETAVEHAKEVHTQNNYPFRLKFVEPYYDHPGFIQALTDTMRPFLEKPYDHILFSYHGIPQRHIRKSDITKQHCLQVADCCNTPSPAHKFCYRHQCFTTTRLVTTSLGIPSNKYSISFQSRLGKGWLEPFTDVRLEQMPKEGIKKLLILCPAFVSDCLETLEEIAMRGRESFLNAGGESYEMIPCINVNPTWIQTLKSLVQTTREKALQTTA